MNRKVTVELDWDTIDKVATCSMKGLVESLEIDLENRKAGNAWQSLMKTKRKTLLKLRSTSMHSRLC